MGRDVERYERNIKPVLGKMLIKDVKPIHCQSVLIEMSKTYSNSMIEYCRVAINAMFSSALENDLIEKKSSYKKYKV